MPIDLACSMGTLTANDDGVSVRWIVVPLLRASDEHFFGRAEPTAHKCHTQLRRNTFNHSPLRLVGEHRIRDDRATISNRGSSALGKGFIDSPRHVGAVAFWTKAFKQRDATQSLPNFIAAEHERSWRRAESRCDAFRNRRFAGAREPSNCRQDWFGWAQ